MGDISINLFNRSLIACRRGCVHLSVSILFTYYQEQITYLKHSYLIWCYISFYSIIFYIFYSWWQTSPAKSDSLIKYLLKLAAGCRTSILAFNKSWAQHNPPQLTSPVRTTVCVMPVTSVSQLYGDGRELPYCCKMQ